MAKVMMDSEIVEALATLAAHGIEAMKVKPTMLMPEVSRGPVSDDEIEESLWSPQAGCAHDISIGIARDILTRFARSRGML